MAVAEIFHTGITVSNLERSIAFYRDVPPSCVADARTFNPGNAHVAFMVTDLDTAYAEMKAKGVRFKSEPVAVTHGRNAGGKAVYFLDPDDVTLELIQPAPRA